MINLIMQTGEGTIYRKQEEEALKKREARRLKNPDIDRHLHRHTRFSYQRLLWLIDYGKYEEL